MFSKTLMAVLAALALSSTAAVAQDKPLISEAHEAYYYEHFGRSLALYEGLAAAGNAEAAERAGYMLMQAPGVYGAQVTRDVQRAHTLLLQAAKAGRPGASFMLNMMDRVE
jgi:TPR repeat protein